MVKTVVQFHIFEETTIYLFSQFFDKKEQRLFPLEMFCNVTNVFTETFDQSNASLPKKRLSFPYK